MNFVKNWVKLSNQSDMLRNTSCIYVCLENNKGIMTGLEIPNGINYGAIIGIAIS